MSLVSLPWKSCEFAVRLPWAYPYCGLNLIRRHLSLQKWYITRFSIYCHTLITVFELYSDRKATGDDGGAHENGRLRISGQELHEATLSQSYYAECHKSQNPLRWANSFHSLVIPQCPISDVVVLENLVGLPIFLCISGALNFTVLKYVCLIALEIGSP